jgi:hypothetical protein
MKLAVAPALIVASNTTMTSLSLLQELPDSSEYVDWKELRQALDNWAVAAKFTYRTAKKGKTVARYICAGRDSGCRWACNASKQEDSGMLELRVATRQHTCWDGGLAKFSSSSNRTWLDEAASQHILVTKTTKPQEIVDTISIHFAEKISYKVAQQCRLRLLDGGLGQQRYSFQLLPAYRDTVELRCPGTTVDLQIDQQTGKSYTHFYASIMLTSLCLQVTSNEYLCVRHTRGQPSSTCDALLLLMEPSLLEGSSLRSC